MYWLYVGDSEGFRVNDGTNSRTIPKSVLDLGNVNLHQCGKARQMLESERYGGRDLDGCASGALLTLRQIREFLDEFWGSGTSFDKAVQQMEQLDGSKTYVLVACEL